MALDIDKYPFTTGAQVDAHLDGKHGGLYVVGFTLDGDDDYAPHFLTGEADLIRGFVTSDLRVTYFAVWKEGE